MILIGGDFVPTGDYYDNLKSGRPIFGPRLKAMVDRAAHVVVNLECPITTKKRPIIKCGPNLKAMPDVLSLAIEAGIDHYSLANNHIYDFGQDGLTETIECLRQANCVHWGAATSRSNLRSEVILNAQDKRVGILSIAEHEFSIATSNHGGAYGLDYIENADKVADLRQRCDHVVILYHGGVEHYRLPTPKQQKFLRHLLRVGADTILCQHSHILGATDATEDGFIHYGQGNFVFQPPRSANAERFSTWNRGSVLSLDIVDGAVATRVLYTRQIAPGLVELEDLSPAEDTAIASLASVVADPTRVAEEWARFVNRRQVDYWSRLYGWSRLRRVLSRELNLSFGTKPGRRWAIIRNVVECESHREALETLWQLQEGSRHPG